MSRRLHLLRHGAPTEAGLLLGHLDLPSSTAGLAQCVAQAAGLRVDAVLSSDLARAAAPAQAIAANLGLPLQVDARWRELDFGRWDGRPAAAIPPAQLRQFHADPDACPPPGGERWAQLQARIGAAIADLPAGDVLVVAHAGAIRAALAQLCGFGRAQTFAIALPYGARLSLQRWPDAAQIVGLQS